MQLQRGDRQNRATRSIDSDEESFECKETLNEPGDQASENRVRMCGCRCMCRNEELIEDPVEKKRQKRKESKRRQRDKLRLEKEQAMFHLERIIRDIYSLRVSFRKAQLEIEHCLSRETNREKICEFINVVIRDEVELIRKEIAVIIRSYEDAEPGEEDEAVKAIFAPIERIAHASGEVEKLINLFVNQFSDEEETPLQKNFGRTTLKFLVRADLYKSGTFSRICSHIFQAHTDCYPRERELVNYMMAAFDSDEDGSLSESSDTEGGGNQEYLEDEDDWEEESSTIESLKCTTQKEQTGQKSRRRRKERRRKLKEDIDGNYQTICKRIEQLHVDNQERSACHVSEDCLGRIRSRMFKYTIRCQPEEGE